MASDLKNCLLVINLHAFLLHGVDGLLACGNHGENLSGTLAVIRRQDRGVNLPR
jgi:hypothetical protein